MKKTNNLKITIAGAGITGCFLAILLAKRGFQVEVYEKLNKEEITSDDAKKSFNHTFYGFAIKALQETNMWDEIEKNFIPLIGNLTQIKKNTKPIFVHYDTKKLQYYTVTRARLISVLIKLGQKYTNLRYHFETPIISINRYEKTFLIEDSKTGKLKKIKTDILIGTDGVNSFVRSYILQGQPSQFVQEYLPWNYKHIDLNREEAQKIKMENNVTHVWTRQNAVFYSFPQTRGSFSTMFVLPNENCHSRTTTCHSRTTTCHSREGGNLITFANMKTAEDIKHMITEYYPQLLPVLPTITEQMLENPTGNFTMVHVSPWYYKDFLVLLGDSAHGFFPFFGQGMSAGFGDALAFVRLIDKYGTDWDKIFLLYEKQRKRHMDRLGDLSKMGFQRFRRYKKADYASIYDRLEYLAFSKFPQFILPPLFVDIADNPDFTDDYYQRHEKQRKIARYLGIPLLIACITGIAAIAENFPLLNKK